jgi:hypothetical protein
LDKPSYEFDDIDDFKRSRDIEEEGTIIGFAGERWIKVAAASDGNPAWRARSEKLTQELNRLRNAKAPNEKVRAFLAKAYAELLCRDWGGWKAGGTDLPFSREACEALLIAADDVYAAIDQVVWDTKNFRGARIEVTVDQGKG